MAKIIGALYSITASILISIIVAFPSFLFSIVLSFLIVYLLFKSLRVSRKLIFIITWLIISIIIFYICIEFNFPPHGTITM